MSFDYSMLDKTALPVGEVRFRPLPATDAVLARVKEAKFTGGTSSKGNAWTRYDVTLEILDGDYLAAAGLEDGATIRYGIMVDTENGVLAMGPNKNIKLNRYRQAVGVNKEGKSLADGVGALVKIAISQRPDPEGKIDEVTGEPIVFSDVSALMAA